MGRKAFGGVSVLDSDIRQSKVEVSSLAVTAAGLSTLHPALMVIRASQMAQ